MRQSLRWFCIASLLCAFAAHARTGTGDPLEVFRQRPHNDESDIDFVLDGHVRLRSMGAFGADLGIVEPTTQQAPFGAGALSHGEDARVRLTPSLFIGESLRVFGDLDLVLLGYGHMASGVVRPSDGLHVSWPVVRALGVDWTLPVGTLSVGRMRSHFGLGIGTNDGADVDDDGGDVADRIAFVAPVLGHLLALAVDLGPGFSPSAFGPSTRALSVGEQAVSFGFMRWHAPWELQLLRAGGRLVVDYGIAGSLEWMQKDMPGLWPRLTAAADAASGGLLPDPEPAVRKNARLLVGDAWLRVAFGDVLSETEAWLGDVYIDNPSPYRGIVLRAPLTGTQWAFASALSLDTWAPYVVPKLEVGAASADPAYGFPVTQPTSFSYGVSGDVFGPQIDASKGDLRIDGARMHALHRVDLILWRTILGGVSEAAYVRGSAKGSPHPLVDVEAVAIYSHALADVSTPGARAPLGVEVDGNVTARVPGFTDVSLRIDAGVLQPLGGMVQRGKPGGSPVTVVMGRVAYVF